jgi:O-antigen/teichoic acid export membrane protein
MSNVPRMEPPAASAAVPRSIAANSAVLAVAQALVKLLGFGVVFVLTRAVSVEAYGRYAFAIAFTAMFLPLADPGADFHATRMVSRDPARAGEYLGASLALKAALLPLLAAVTLGVAWATGHRGETLALVAFAVLAGWLLVMCGSYFAVLRGLRLMTVEAWFLVVTRTVAFALTLGVLAAGGGVLGAGAVQVVATVIGVPLMLGLAGRVRLVPQWVRLRALGREMLTGGVAFAATALLVMVYYRVDVLMLSRMRGERSVGFYGAGTNLMFAVLLASQVLVQALFPVIARAGSLADPLARQVGRRAMTLSLVMSVPFALGGCFVAAPVLALAYGPAYAEAARALAFLMLTLPVLFANNLIGNALGAVGRQRVVLVIALVDLAINVALNLVLIPRMDYAGAALATLLSEVAGLAMMALVLRGDFAALFAPGALLKLLAANAALAALLIVARGLPIAAVLALAVVVYGGLVLALKLLAPAELRAMFAPGGAGAAA